MYFSEDLMKQLLTIGRNLDAPTALQDLAFKYLYLITKVSKAIVQILKIRSHK